MTKTRAPYSHYDGSNCWTKNCSRNVATLVSVLTTQTALDDEEIQRLQQLWADKPRVLNMELQVRLAKKVGEQFTEHIKPHLLAQSLDEVPHMTRENSEDLVREYNSVLVQIEAEYSQEEKESLRKYLGIHFDPIRQLIISPDKYLAEAQAYDNKLATRGEKPIHTWQERHQKLQAIIKDLDRITATQYSLSVPVWRGISPQEYGTTPAEIWATQLGYKEGATIKNDSFASTSIDPGIAVSFAASNPYGEAVGIVFKITPKHGIPTTELTDYSSIQETEKEVLLPRGIEYRVKSVGRTHKLYHRDLQQPVVPLVIELEEI